MAKREKHIAAAGAVVLRRGSDGPEVAVVHRPRYDDWSLPKGKSRPGESSPATAVREVAEETGLQVVLDCRLDSQRYRVPAGAKQVHWWRAGVRAEHHHDPDREVDRVRWWSPRQARKRLTHGTDVRLLEQALTVPATTAVVLLRHAKAMERKNWSQPDPARPLNRRGRQQAEDLVPMLSAFGIGAVLSSSSVRCASTVRPFAEATATELALCSRLSEEEGTDDPDGVAAVVEEFVGAAHGEHRPVALCGHRPVIPHMQDALWLPRRGLATAEMVLAHLGTDGEMLAVERHRPSS